jgi:hypothetical protein
MLEAIGILLEAHFKFGSPDWSPVGDSLSTYNTIMFSSGRPTIRTPRFTVHVARSCSSRAPTTTLAPVRACDAAPRPRCPVPSSAAFLQRRGTAPLAPHPPIRARASLTWGVTRRGHCTCPPATPPVPTPRRRRSPHRHQALCEPTSLNLSKQQGDIMLKVHVASVCFKCFSCFGCMLQVFYLDVTKVD